MNAVASVIFAYSVLPPDDPSPRFPSGGYFAHAESACACADSLLVDSDAPVLRRYVLPASNSYRIAIKRQIENDFRLGKQPKQETGKQNQQARLLHLAVPLNLYDVP